MQEEFTTKLFEKRWNRSLEEEIYAKWEKEKVNAFNLDSKKPLFTLDTPPPYPSGRPWHIGAAAHYSQIDMIARTARMSGHEVLFPIGIDRNGLPVEIYTEKKFNLSIKNTPREKFIELCTHALDDLEAEMIQVMKTIGISGEFKDYYRTDSDQYRKLTQATFIQLWKRGMIYEATRPNNYCTKCGTTIADADVGYINLPANLVYMKFKVRETGSEIVVASTRPELLCSCQVVIVNPQDERYVGLHGLHVTIPLYNRDVEIKHHPRAKPEFGSGAVMVCSYGDYDDVLLFREMGLEEIISIDASGRMTEKAGKYRDQKIKLARDKIIEDLKNKGIIVKIEGINHRTPVCERSKTSIEIIPMNEFYLKQLDFVEDLKKMVDEIEFHPKEHKQILLDWVNSVTIDWPVSRRRYYATEIPVWYCQDCREVHLPESIRYYRPWIDPAPFQKCRKCGCKKFEGDNRTFDTWMDSSISPLFVTRYQENKDLFSKIYPISIRPQGKDIVRTWLHYTLLRCYQLTSKSPFKHVWIMGYGVDEKGERMSKSKGNVIDPVPLLKQYGADCFRLWAASESSLGSDFRCSEPRIKGAGLFLTKLWNVSRYVTSFPFSSEVELQASDKWILAELSLLTKKCMEGYRDFNFFIPANRVREFAWNLFASNYVELSKARAYGIGFSQVQQESAWCMLHKCLQTILLLVAPITPFITDYIWRRVYGEDGIHKNIFPENKCDMKLQADTQRIVGFNSHVWNLKKSKKIALKESISIDIPKNLEPYLEDLKAMHHIE